MLRFANPEYLYLLLLLPLLGYYLWRGRVLRRGQMGFSTVRFLQQIPRSWRGILSRHLYVLRLLSAALLMVALARPQSGSKEQEVTTEGIDIMLVVDVSSSMQAEDFKPKNRLGAAKTVATEFIDGRQNDPIGLVVFAGEAFSQCPLTLDYQVLRDILDDTKIAPREWDGTAIGNGLASAVARLRDSKAESKVVILLTDGENNAGEVDPMTAAQVARTFDIRVYTIGAGTRGTAMFPIDDPLFGRQYKPIQVEIDEELLTNIANVTGGRYFRATNTEMLRDIYGEIGELEKTRIEVKEFTRYTELFWYFAGAGLALLLLQLILENTALRRLP